MPDTILECSRLIEARELAVEELVGSVLARLDETEPVVHAYAYVDHEGARAAAREADEEIRGGRYRGPMHGIPVGVKDVFCTADMPTRAGSEVWIDPLGEDAASVRLLRAAGAIIIGKHVTHEFACGQNVPPTRNAWDAGRYPGGSTAGGGTSVALGSSLGAIGTDAGGSVRKPAALNGVVGIKGTFGRISRVGVVPPSGSMDHVGIITRTVRDACLMLQSLCHADSEDPTLVDGVVPDFSSQLGMSLRGLRIGISDYFFSDSSSPGVSAVTSAAVEILRRAGATLCDVDIPQLEMSPGAGAIIIQVEAAASHVGQLKSTPQVYGTATRRYLEEGTFTPAIYLRAASIARAALCRRVRDVFRSERLDALVSPTTPLTAMRVEDMSVERDLPRYIRYTVMANLTGLPAITVPCGFADGLPVGLQFVGRPFHEAELLGLAAAYEALTDWVNSRPLAAAQPANGRDRP